MQITHRRPGYNPFEIRIRCETANATGNGERIGSREHDIRLTKIQVRQTPAGQMTVQIQSWRIQHVGNGPVGGEMYISPMHLGCSYRKCQIMALSGYFSGHLYLIGDGQLSGGQGRQLIEIGTLQIV